MTVTNNAVRAKIEVDGIKSYQQRIPAVITTVFLVDEIVSGINSTAFAKVAIQANPGDTYIVIKQRTRFFDFTEDDQAEYMENHQLPRNPVKDILGMSGECLCGAYAKEGELDRIRKHYPDVANRIEALENEVIAAGFPWGWEDSVPAWYTKKKLMDNFGQEDFFDIERDEVLSDQGFQPLCTTCNYNGSL